MESSEILGIAHGCPAPRHIDIVSLSLLLPHVRVTSIRAAWVEHPVVIAMERDIEHPVCDSVYVCVCACVCVHVCVYVCVWRVGWEWEGGGSNSTGHYFAYLFLPFVIVEHVLCGVAMVNVPIHYHDTAEINT